MYRKQPQRQKLRLAGTMFAISFCLTFPSISIADTGNEKDVSVASAMKQKINEPLISKPGITVIDPSQAVLAQSNATYSYDALGRLSKIMINGKLITEYQYDAVGNRTQKQHHQ